MQFWAPKDKKRYKNIRICLKEGNKGGERTTVSDSGGVARIPVLFNTEKGGLSEE